MLALLPTLASPVLSALEILLVISESSLFFSFLINAAHHEIGFLCVLQTNFCTTAIKVILEIAPLA